MKRAFPGSIGWNSIPKSPLAAINFRLRRTRNTCTISRMNNVSSPSRSKRRSWFIQNKFLVANFELLSFASADELARTAAGAWLDEIELANRAGRTYCVALPGGRITQKFFTATVAQAAARKVA